MSATVRPRLWTHYVISDADNGRQTVIERPMARIRAEVGLRTPPSAASAAAAQSFADMTQHLQRKRDAGGAGDPSDRS
jgi:hypothetical protein